MVDTYTPQTGLTPQGTQLNSMNNILSSITGMVQQQPQVQQNLAGQGFSQQGLPGAVQSYGNLQQMYQELAAHQMNMEQQYPQLTPPQGTGNLGIPGVAPYPTVTAPNPAFSTAMASADTKNITDLMGNLANYVTQGYGNIKGSLAQNQQTYRDTLGALQGILGNTMDVYKSQQLTPKDVADIKLSAMAQGYDFDPLTGKFSALGLGLPSGGVGDAQTLRTQYQKAYESTPSLQVRQKIAQDFKTTTGAELFPGKLSAQELTQIQNTNEIINDLNFVKQTVSSGKLDQWMGLVGGNIARALSDPKVASLLPADVHKTLRILLKFKTAGERTAIGGRLTGYLLDRLGPAFPELSQGKENVLTAVNDYINNGMRNMETIAQEKGYSGLDDFPYYKTGDMIQNPTGGGSYTVGRFTVTQE